MASVPCTIQLHLPTSESSVLRSRFVPVPRRLGCFQRALSGIRNKAGLNSGRGQVTCLFKFGPGAMDAEGAGIYGSQKRDDFSHFDVEQYFDYMGMLAVEGSYDKVEALLAQDIAPVDIMLMLAASEGDRPKIEEVMRAGARYDVKDVDGRTALDRADCEETRQLILSYSAQRV